MNNQVKGAGSLRDDVEKGFEVESISISLPSWVNEGLGYEQEEALKGDLLEIPGVSSVKLYSGGTLEIAEVNLLRDVQREAAKVCRAHALNPPPFSPAAGQQNAIPSSAQVGQWRFGAQKGAVYMFPADGGVQAGYQWVATTDPEQVGLPENQEVMEAMARRLADTANACLGMEDPVAEVAQLVADRARKMTSRDHDRNLTGTADPGAER